MINLFPFLKGRRDDQKAGIPILFYLLRSNKNDIYGLPDSVQVHVYLSRKMPLMEFPAFYNEQIHITVRTHLSSRSRAEQDYSFRLGNVHNSADDFLKDFFT